MSASQSTVQPLAIDALVNSSFLDPERGVGLAHLFPDLANRPKIDSPDQLIELMVEAGVGACVLSIMDEQHAKWVADAHARYPKRILPALRINPLRTMEEMERVTRHHELHGVRCLRIPPFQTGLPPTDRVFWPFYVRALELDLTVSMNAGMPGPRHPGWVQQPIHFDEVAFHFPDLRLVMTHSAQPWTDEAIATLVHWDNVWLAMTSVAPRYWHPSLLPFLNTRGKRKVLFGTEYPVIPWSRAVAETAALEIRDEVRPLFFVENAKAAFAWDASP